MMNLLWLDLRYSARRLLKTPGFTLTVVATLALGVGANTAIFNVINAHLFKPMPVRQPDRLVAVYPVTREGEMLAFSWLEYLDFGLLPALQTTKLDLVRTLKGIG